MVLNGGKLSFLVQIPYYWRILQSNIYVNFYRKELCNNEFNNIAIWRISRLSFALADANVCKASCKRLQPRLQTFAGKGVILPPGVRPADRCLGWDGILCGQRGHRWLLLMMPSDGPVVHGWHRGACWYRYPPGNKLCQGFCRAGDRD